MTAPGVARLGAPDVNTNFMHLFEPIEVSLAPGVGSGVFFIKECEILDQNGQTVMKGGYDSENYICYNIFARHLPVQTQNGQLMVSVPAGILSMGGKSYDLSGLVELSNVAGTGDYSDLSNILLLNGAASNTGDQTFYAPTSSGTAGQILTSTGPNSAPSWANFPTAGLNVLGGVKLNQNADTSAVALTTGGTGGGNYPLKLSNTSVAYTNVPPATTSVFGVVKLGSDTVQTATAASGSPFSASGRTYPIQNNSGGQLVVNVPWTDSSTTPQLSFDEVFSGSSDPLPFSGLRLRVGDSAMDFIPIAGKFDYTVNYENNSIGVDDPINIYYDSYEQTGENNGLGLIRLFSNRDQEPLDWDCINGDSRHCLYGSSNGLLTNETMNNRDAQFYRVDGRNYPLKLDRVGVAYVTVPWESGGGGTYNYNELLNRLLLNGASGNTGDKTFYAPISGGTNGYILKSNGPSAAPDWMVPDTIPQLSAPPAGTPPTGRVFIWVQ
jgi:hypothetical protein